MVFEAQWNTLLWITCCIWSPFLYLTVVCSLCLGFFEAWLHWRSFHVWRVRLSVPWSFSPRKAFVALGYGVVFVAHRKISFVSCMVGLPIVCSIWCVVWLCHFFGLKSCLYSLRVVWMNRCWGCFKPSTREDRIRSDRIRSDRWQGLCSECIRYLYCQCCHASFQSSLPRMIDFLYILGLWETDTNLYWHSLTILWSG